MWRLGLLVVVLWGSGVGGGGEMQTAVSAEVVDPWPAGSVQAAGAIAALAPVEQTGQATCWNSDGDARDCTGTGEDGELQAGVEWPAPRFMDNGDGTVTDNLTDLIWLKNGNCFGPRTWTQALSDANGLTNGQCGLTDGSAGGAWRLPNLKELLSLRDFGEFDPALPSDHPFTGFQPGSHWSSTTLVIAPEFARSVALDSGLVLSAEKTNPFLMVWPVRGAGSGGMTGPAPVEVTGQTMCWDEDGVSIACSGTGQDGELRAGVNWPAPRFTSNGNGSVTDNLTGLIWLQNASCYGLRTWSQALSDANGLMNGQCGLTDGSLPGEWRLPNHNEVTSLFDYGQSNPGLPSGHPFSNVQSTTWLSTTQEIPGSTDNAWIAFMNIGGTAGRAKDGLDYGWAVRGGSTQEIEGTCSHYELVRVGSPLSWDEARTLAQALGPTWDLASITSAGENDFVESLFANDPSFFNMDAVPGATNRSGPWIGAFNVLGTTNFEWVSGEPVTFTDWGPAEPFGNGDTIAYADFSSPYGDGSGIAWNDIGPELRSDGPIAYLAESRVPGSQIPGSQVIFCDGFESGDTAAWSSTVARDLEVQTSNANSGLYAARLPVARACTAGDAIVPDGELTGDPPVEPCGTLTANDVDVVSGTVRFAAGVAIEIGNGFSVASAATFVAEAGETVLGSAYVRDESPESVTEYQLRFAIDPDALTLAQDAEQFDHLVAYDAQGNPEFLIGVTYNTALAENRLFVTAWENDGTSRSTQGLCELALTSGWQPLEVSWRASTGTDGDVEISVDGGRAQSLVACLSLAGGLNNGSGEINAVEWGAQNVSAGSFGEMDLDDFQSWEPQ